MKIYSLIVFVGWNICAKCDFLKKSAFPSKIVHNEAHTYIRKVKKGSISNVQ